MHILGKNHTNENQRYFVTVSDVILQSGSFPSSIAYKFGMVFFACTAAARVLAWSLSWRLSPIVTFPFKSLAARVKKEGPNVSEVGASVGLATV